jgi:hypothetical protein
MYLCAYGPGRPCRKCGNVIVLVFSRSARPHRFNSPNNTIFEGMRDLNQLLAAVSGFHARFCVLLQVHTKDYIYEDARPEIRAHIFR